MGKSISKVASGVTGAVGGILGAFKPGKYSPTFGDKGLYDLTQEVKPAQEDYAALLGRSRALSEAGGTASADVLKQMGQAALGRGPSLAEAQLKAAQDRNLSQQLAALQSSRAGSSALGQRALLQSMGQSGQDLAQQAAVARLGERANFLQAAGAADSGLRSDIQGKLGVDVMPKQAMQAYDQQKTGAINQANQANAAAKTQMAGALIGGLGSIAGGMATGGTGFFAPALLKKAEGGHVTKKKLMKPQNYAEGGFVEALEKAARDLGKKIKDDSGRKQEDINKQKFMKTKSNVGFKNGGLYGSTKDLLTDKEGRLKKESEIAASQVGSSGMSDNELLAAESKRRAVAAHYAEKSRKYNEELEEAARRKDEMENEEQGYKRFIPKTKKAKGGEVDSPKKTTVVPDKGFGKIIIIEDDREMEKRAMGGSIQDHRDGGDVNGPGTETSDSIPAMLSDGEFVIKASEVKKPGILAHLEAINSGKLTKKHLSSLAKALEEKNKKGGRRGR